MKPSVRLRALQLRHRGQRWLPWLVGALGVAMLCVGATVLFTTHQDARSAFLLTLGLVLLLVAVFRGRIELEGFEIFGAKARVRDVVKRRLELADSPDAGRPPDPARLQRQAAMLQRLVGLYGLYDHIRSTQAPGPGRTRALDQLAARMRAAGRGAEFDVAEVVGWFHEGTDALRVIALNLMLANEGYRDTLAVLQSIDAPHSLFEQYYGLVLADEMRDDLDVLERRLVSEAIARAERRRRFKRDPSLPSLAERVRAHLDA
jgi:hypothetical protein